MPATAPLITDSDVAQFRRDGFCIVPGLWSEQELAAIEAFFEDYKRIGAAVFDAGMRFEEIDPAQQQVRAMHPHRQSDAVRGWALNPRVLAALGVLFGRPPLLAQTMYYFKPPGAKGQGMHQDEFYLLTQPHACIAAWTPIDDARIENGCLYVVRGSQTREILCPKGGAGPWMHYGDSHITPFPADAIPEPVEVPRGATMFFGGHLIHGSGPNRTADRSRRTFIGHYIDDASEQIAKFYHPILDAEGRVVSRIGQPGGGGPCGDGWLGAVH